MSAETVSRSAPETREGWITGEEYAREWERLSAAGLRRSLEMEALFRRVDERNGWLLDTYARPLLADHYGKWIAVSLDGEYLLAEHEIDVFNQADERFGEGNYASARLTEARGPRLLSPRDA